MPRAGSDSWKTALALGAFVPIYLFASPFRFGDKSSGRYLLGVLQKLDGDLFVGDAAVAALDRFGSLFYSTAGIVLRGLGVPAESFEPTWYGFYLLARLGLLFALWRLARALDHRAGLAIALLAWGAHIKPSFVGGTALFAPLLSHHQIAVLLCLLALGALLSNAVPPPEIGARTALSVGGLIGLALLVHPLVAGYFTLALVPTWWFWRGQRAMPWLSALALIAACGGVYLLLLAPPSMTPQEVALFLAHKADTGHVSLWHQPEYAWLKLGLLLALASPASKRLITGHAARWLRSAAFWGAAGALGLALLAEWTNSVLLTRLQPLRGFLWVQFFCELLLLWATVEAWRRKAAVLPALLGTMAFMALDSVWFIAWMVLALVLLVAESSNIASAEQRRTLGRISGLLLLLLIGTFFLLGERQPLASARDVTGVLGAICLGWILVDSSNRRRGWQIAVLVVTVLAASSWRDHRATQPDLAWQETGRWVRQHTAKSARFLTRPGLPNFRFAAWRTSLSEALSALYWVDPSALQPAAENARRFNACRKTSGDWNLEALLELAEQTGSAYVVVDGAIDTAPAQEPVFERSPYRIFVLAPPLEGGS